MQRKFQKKICETQCKGDDSTNNVKNFVIYFNIPMSQSCHYTNFLTDPSKKESPPLNPIMHSSTVYTWFLHNFNFLVQLCYILWIHPQSKWVAYTTNTSVWCIVKAWKVKTQTSYKWWLARGPDRVSYSVWAGSGYRVRGAVGITVTSIFMKYIIYYTLFPFKTLGNEHIFYNNFTIG